MIKKNEAFVPKVVLVRELYQSNWKPTLTLPFIVHVIFNRGHDSPCHSPVLATDILVFHAGGLPISYSQQSQSLFLCFHLPDASIFIEVHHSPCFCIKLEIVEVKYNSFWTSLPHSWISLVKIWFCFPISSRKGGKIACDYPSCWLEFHSKHLPHLSQFRKKKKKETMLW